MSIPTRTQNLLRYVDAMAQAVASEATALSEEAIHLADEDRMVAIDHLAGSTRALIYLIERVSR